MWKREIKTKTKLKRVLMANKNILTRTTPSLTQLIHP